MIRASALVFVGLLAGCATASSTRNQIDAQTRQNRALLTLEKQRTRELTASRGDLQHRLDEKYQRRATLRIQDETPETQEETRRLNAEIVKLKQAILKSAE